MSSIEDQSGDIPGHDDLARCAAVLQYLRAARASASRGESQAARHARRDHDRALKDYRPTTW